MDGEDNMEVSLVQQFSCMGTTDKDVLIAQLQKLIGPDIHSDTAQFFLDMNNWNLQEAVGAYFDYLDEAGPVGFIGAGINGLTSNYSMQLLEDLSLSEDTAIPPFTKFVKVWRIKNTGLQPWPTGSCLRYKSGTRMFTQERVPIDPPVQPGEIRDLSVEFFAPSAHGNYDMRWQMCTPDGHFFGEEIWAIVTIAPDLTVGLTERLQSLHCDQDQATSVDNNSMMD